MIGWPQPLPLLVVGGHWAATEAGGSAMCRWRPALLNTIRAGASPAARGMETAADCPAANTVSNRSTAALAHTATQPLLVAPQWLARRIDCGQHVIIKDDLRHEVGQAVITIIVTRGHHCDEIEGWHNKYSLAALPLRLDPIDPFARYE